jgi:hypothetical protein
MTLCLQKRCLSAVALALTLWLTSACVAPSVAKAAPPTTATTTQHKKNWIQRHPTATGVGVGLATHHALKVSAARKKARGQKLSWAERHPTLTGIGAGATTRHMIKKHTAK